MSRSTLDYAAGYSPTLKQWIPLRDGRVLKGLTQIGVRATLRAVQAGGESWQIVVRAPEGRIKRLFPTAYQARGPGGASDCFAGYLTQRQLCQSRTAQVLWFVDAACLQPGAWTFTLEDQPSGGEQGVAALTVTVPGTPKQGAGDPCAVKPTPVTDHDRDPVERAFQMFAQRELTLSRIGPTRADPSLIIQLVSRGDLLLTDEGGRRTGFDAAAGVARDEIPHASYRDSPVPAMLAQDLQPRPIRSITVAHPESADYVLRVQRTGGEPYWLSVGTSQDARSITLVQTDPHASSEITYDIRVNPSDLQQLHVSGGFAGGERSGGHDELLTFGSPTSSRTPLPTGTAHTDILIFYSPDIEPGSFRARLNGRDAISRFHPYKGWREVVSVPLAAGDNRLDLLVRGRVHQKRHTARVGLTFTVTP